MVMGFKSSNLRKRSKYTAAWSLLVLACLIPLLFINIRDSHDWGDDFAMYLMEAQNIAGHKAAGQTGFMTNPNAMMGPQAYPVGYPLMLAPLVGTFGPDFRILNLFQSALLVCTLFFGFLFLRRHFTALSSLLMTLVIAYNPVILQFKTEILSDIPFWLLLNLVLCLVYYHRYSAVWMLLTGALLGFSIHLRSIGFALTLSFILFRLINDFKNNEVPRYLKTYLSFIIGFSLVYISLKVILPVDSSYTYFDGDLLTTSANHLSYNLESISSFFKSPGLSDYYFITHLCGYAFLIFMILGIIVELRQNTFSFVNLLTFLFFGVVIVYHLGDAGIRLILPLLFIFFYYFACGFKTVILALQLNHKVTAIVAVFFFLPTYVAPLKKIAAAVNEIPDGPFTPDSKEMFAFMKTSGIVHKNIGFDRPRVLALFTSNNSVHLSDMYLPEEVVNYKLEYILVHHTETSSAKQNYIKSKPQSFEKIFSNATYEMYRTIPAK